MILCNFMNYCNMFGLNRLWSSKVVKLIYCPCGVGVTSRHLSLNAQKNSKTLSDDFVPIYKFPYIRPISMINRLKMYQTLLTVLGIPSGIVLNQMDLIDTDSLYFLSALGTSGCLTLYSLGLLTTKFVGFIYYNEEKNLAKISFMDFWGNRKDIFVPTSDIIPINESPATPLDGLFFTLRRYSTKETLRLSLKFGIIVDKEKLEKVL